MQMAVVGKIVADNLLIFMLQDALLDTQHRTIGRHVCPAIAPMAHKQALLFHHDGGPGLVHLNRKIEFQLGRTNIVAHQFP